MNILLPTNVKKTPCHKGPIEICPGLWLGNQDEGELALKEGKAKIAVPLNRMEGSIWEKWDGEVIYIPIKDFSVLPKAVAEKKVKELVEKIKISSISMFCLGGHGRTGYMAALVLGFIGYKDPIAFLRENYCKEAVESFSQIEQIAEILQNPTLLNHSPAKLYSSVYYYQSFFAEAENEGQCSSCVFFDTCHLPMPKTGVCPYFIKKGGDIL